MRSYELVNIKIDGTDAVDGEGLCPRSSPEMGASFYLLNINLSNAPEFIFVFSDGYKANSRNINKALLEAHGLSIETYRGYTAAYFRSSDQTKWESATGKGYWYSYQ